MTVFSISTYVRLDLWYLGRLIAFTQHTCLQRTCSCTLPCVHVNHGVEARQINIDLLEHTMHLAVGSITDRRMRTPVVQFHTWWCGDSDRKAVRFQITEHTTNFVRSLDSFQRHGHPLIAKASMHLSRWPQSIKYPFLQDYFFLFQGYIRSQFHDNPRVTSKTESSQ